MSPIERLSLYQLWPELTAVVGVLITLAWHRKVFAWRYVSAVVALEAVKIASTLLYLHHPTLAAYRAHFYCYWTADGLAAFAGIGILADLIRNIPLGEHAPKNILLTLRAFAAVTACACIGMAIASNPHHQFAETTFVMEMYHCIGLLWGAFAACTLLGIAGMGFGWTRSGLRISVPFTLQILARILTTTFEIHHTHQAEAVALGYDTFSTVVYATWLYTFAFHAEHQSARIPVDLKGEGIPQLISAEAQR